MATKSGDHVVTMEDLAPHCCKVYGVEVRKDRPCMYFKNLLTKEECARLMKLCDERHLKEGDPAIDSCPACRSQFNHSDAALATKILKRIEKFIPKEMDGGKLMGLRREFNHARYLIDSKGRGQSVMGHMDQRQPYAEEIKNDDTLATRMSLTIYLDEGYTGAEFVFIKGLKDTGLYDEAHKILRPRAGDAVIFYQGIPEFAHAVPPLKSRKKTIMRTDVLYKFRTKEEANAGGQWAPVKGGKPL